MNEIKIDISFENQTCNINGINIITGDYNSTKLVFTFDKEDGTKLFKMKNPNDETIFTQEIENNEVVLVGETEEGELASLFQNEGDYTFEVALYDGDSRITSISNVLSVLPEQVVVDGGEEIEAYKPLFDQLLANLSTAFAEVENIDISAIKEDHTATITITKKDGTQETVEINDGEKGETGATGATGATGTGISSIVKTGTQDLVDTYTIYLTDGTSYTFTVTNGETGGTSDYSELENKPSINSVELNGNKTLSELGIQPAGNYVTPDTESLNNYYKKSETYTKTEVDNKVSSVYRYRGTVATYADLPSQDLVVGDVYNVETDGSNYAWTGTVWDKLGADIDLSAYYTISETDGLLNAKQNIMQYNTMPTASASNLGQIVQYTGTTDTTYTNGYFYTCTTDGSSYSWEEATVQASSGGDYNYLIANFPAASSSLSTTHIIVITSNTNINQSWFNTYKQALIDGINDDRILFPTRIYFALYMPDRIFETIDAYNRTQTGTKSVRYHVRDLTGASKDGDNYIYNNNGTITFSINYSDLTSGLTSSNVQLYGAQTITGLKTFNVLPQSSVVPTNNNDLVNKAYVDAQGGGTTLDGYYSEQIVDSTYTLSPDTGAGIYVLTNVSGADTTVTIDGAPSDYGEFVLANTDALIVEVNVVEFDEKNGTQKVKVTCRSAKQAPVELYYEWDDTEGALVYNHGAYNGVSIFNITDSDISYPDQTSYNKFEAIFDKYVNQNKQVIIIHNNTKYSYFIECYPSGNDKYITAYINENEAYQQQIANTNDYFINNMTFRFTMKYDYNSGQWSNTDRKWVGHKSLASSYNDIYGSDARTPISRESVYEMADLNEYDYSGVYAVGDYVRYENKIYKCNTATTEEDFDSNKWTEKTYLQYLSDVLVGSALGGSY